MKFHASVIEDIILNCRNFGGHASERKLREVLGAKRYAIYVGDRRDMVLVDAERYMKEAFQRGQSTNQIVPMTLHPKAFEKIMYFFDLYSGYDTEAKLRHSLTSMDFTPYERKLGGNRDTILVLTEDYAKALQGSP
ncbi:MAG: hypothetical protein EBU90_31020 [Proteobacteria bacterium]|nr:hypothetical protein [Pseudomonadota bacterium]